MASSLNTTTTISNRAIGELKSDTIVKRRWSAPDARSGGGASLRGQTTTTVGWRGSGPRDLEKRTRCAPLGGYILVDYNNSDTAAAAAADNHIVKYKIPRQVDSAVSPPPE